jgi:hypothetical protein
MLKVPSNTLEYAEWMIILFIGHLRSVTTFEERSPKVNRLHISVILVILAATVVLADDASLSLHGMTWGSPIEDHPNLVLVQETEMAAYYTDDKTVFQVADQKVDRVVYGFYKGKLFAGFIHLSLPVQFVNLKSHFSKRYGPATINYGKEGKPTVYRWKTGHIKIKLKISESGKEMKLAVYYTPLSKKLNEERLENQADTSRRFLPIEKDKTPEMVPLFRF